MQVRKSRKSLLRRINVSRRSSKSNIHKITRIISTAGVYPLIKKALDNIFGCRFIISFPCNQIKSNLAEQKLYHNMGKMSQKFMLRLTLRQQSYKIKSATDCAILERKNVAEAVSCRYLKNIEKSWKKEQINGGECEKFFTHRKGEHYEKTGLQKTTGGMCQRKSWNCSSGRMWGFCRNDRDKDRRRFFNNRSTE